MKLNVWYIQQVLTYELPWDFESAVIRYQPLRFTKRNGNPETRKPQPTLEAARKLCGDPTAELL